MSANFTQLPRDFHNNLPNDQLHEPRGFGTASDDTELQRSINPTATLLDKIQWRAKTWIYPVIDVVEASSAPPTENIGDRYIIVDTLGSGADSGWDGAAVNDVVEFFDADLDGTGDEWGNVAPEEGYIGYVKDAGEVYLFDGSDWVTLITVINASGVDIQTVAGSGTKTVTHNLGTRDVDVTIKEAKGAEWKKVSPPWETSGTNAIKVGLPNSKNYRIITTKKD